jgi:ABC-type nitrate/sulfonate/bicarbonate transport system substrate-binding protein
MTLDHVRYARFPPASSLIAAAPVIVGLADGLFEAHGIDLEVFVPPVHSWESISAGEADCGACYFAFCARPSFLGTMRAMAVHERHSPGHGFTALVGRPELVDEGRLNDDPASIAGLRIGWLPNRPDDYMAWHGLLRLAGLTWADVEVVPVPHDGPGRIAALTPPDVDVVIARGPSHRQEDIDAGLTAWWKIGQEVSPDFQSQFLVAHVGFLRDRFDVAVRFLGGYLDGVRRVRDAFDDGVDRDRIFGHLTDATGLPGAFLEVMYPGGWDPTGLIDSDALERDVATLQKAGFVGVDVAADALADFRVARDAQVLLAS